jgi:hypothetical protein
MRIDGVAAFELIGINVSYELTQSFKVLLPRLCLIVLFDERDRQNMLQSKALIIESAVDQSK